MDSRPRIDSSELVGFALFGLGPMLGTVIVVGEYSRYLAYWLPAIVYAIAFSSTAYFVWIRGSLPDPSVTHERSILHYELSFVLMEVVGLTMCFALFVREFNFLVPDSFLLVREMNWVDWLRFASLDVVDCLLLGAPSVYGIESKAITAQSFAARTLVFFFRVLLTVFVVRTLTSHWKIIPKADFVSN